MKEIGVGILGFGTVGAGVAEGLLRNRKVMAERLGVDIVLRKIADLDITTDRGVAVDSDVDIIAYQDEIGCVRERFPMRRMKRNFRKLGEIHKSLELEFWVNIENFTWDRGTNNWYSSLIPAEFGRYLSQIVSAIIANSVEVFFIAIVEYSNNH